MRDKKRVSWNRQGMLLPLLAALMIWTAACSAQEPQGNAAATPEPTAQVSEAPPAETSELETGEAETAEPQQRVVEHDGGQTVIVGEPQRIAVLDYRLADTMLALGIKPHAMATYLGSTELPYMDGNPLAEAIPLGDTANMEALIDAEPDLIIARSTDNLEQLQKIAPTIVAGAAGKYDDWKESVRELARYLDRESEAEAWLADFGRKAAELREEIAGRIEPDATFLYLRVMPKEVRVHGLGQALAQTLFGELGLKPVDGLENVARIEAISLEALPDFDADYIFMEVGAPGDTDARKNLSELRETAVWQNLKAVRNDRLYEAPQWIISDFPYIKLKSLDIIREALLP